jgi:protein SCO1/2
MKSLITLCGLVLTLAGCKPASTPPAAAATNQTFSVRGVIQQIPPDHRHVTIKHEKIPGYMAAMTMDFSVRDTNALAGFAPGDEISFALVVTDDDDWIENLKRTGKVGAVSGPPGWTAVEPELSVGDILPDYEFTSETGRTVKFSDFRGGAVAFTFFFTSCPLPEYCPRMNKNLAEARNILLSATNAPANWQFLSISFDSSFDSPQVLSSYASLYRGTNADRWLFTVASTNTLASLAAKVDLNFWRENGTISHNLRTVVLDGGGKIFKQFDGNDWTPQQLADALREAAKANAQAK